MDELWLGSHVIGMFHRVSCVDHIHLQRTKITEAGVPRVPDRRLWSQSGDKASRLRINRAAPVTRKMIKRRPCQPQTVLV